MLKVDINSLKILTLTHMCNNRNVTYNDDVVNDQNENESETRVFSIKISNIQHKHFYNK